MSVEEPRKRRELVRTSSALNGIDFVKVEVASDVQTTLVVHFLNGVAPSSALATDKVTTSKDVLSSGEPIAAVPVVALEAFNETSKTLRLTVTTPGDSSLYTLKITDPKIDPHFSVARFAFDVLSTSTVDCQAPEPACPPGDAPAPPIDYLAKDFLSFKQALSDFSALRYPGWQERAEADFGVMIMEALAALADDLSYLQDRVAAEAWLDTATERRSIVRHARLVDYEPRPSTASRVLLRFLVTTDGAVTRGSRVSAPGPGGAAIDFETGTGLDDSATYPVRTAWNAIEPYWWDDGDRCLRAGATSVWVVGPGDALAALRGRQVLLDAADPTDATRPPRRQVVTVTQTQRIEDPLFSTYVTQLRWDDTDALANDYDLGLTTLSANLVPATQGRTCVEGFSIEADPQSPSASGRAGPLALRRLGPAAPASSRPGDRWIWGAGSSPSYLYPLRRGPLTWLAPVSDPAGTPAPEIHLDVADHASNPRWHFVRRLLDARALAQAFTVDPVAYRALAPTRSDGSVFADYDGRGDTIRFGDGAFGRLPAPGTSFTVTYRVGAGAAGNVAAGAISSVDPASPLAALVSAVDNPFPATGGADAETDESVRRMAPEAYQVDQRRAVLPSDYDAAAEKLPWVQRAGTNFRWTGSWPTVFTSADPRGAESMSATQARALIDLVNRYRLAGYESYVLQPRFASLDLQIEVSATADAFQSDVQKAILDALSSGTTRAGKPGFFHPDRFTFGQPLERSALEAAIQRVPGVEGVESIQYRRRDRSADLADLPNPLTVSHDHIIRADNDPSLPERGSVKVFVKGGK